MYTRDTDWTKTRTIERRSRILPFGEHTRVFARYKRVYTLRIYIYTHTNTKARGDDPLVINTTVATRRSATCFRRKSCSPPIHIRDKYSVKQSRIGRCDEFTGRMSTVRQLNRHFAGPRPYRENVRAKTGPWWSVLGTDEPLPVIVKTREK